MQKIVREEEYTKAFPSKKFCGEKLSRKKLTGVPLGSPLCSQGLRRGRWSSSWRDGIEHGRLGYIPAAYSLYSLIAWIEPCPSVLYIQSHACYQSPGLRALSRTSRGARKKSQSRRRGGQGLNVADDRSKQYCRVGLDVTSPTSGDHAVTCSNPAGGAVHTS